MSRIHKLLIVDNNADLRATLAEQLTMHEEFSIVEAGKATEALSMARIEQPDLVLVEICLPDMSGLEAVKLMRKNGFRRPIIILTGEPSDSEAILGLEAGANDYIGKPIRFPILLARIRAHLRHHNGIDNAMLRLGGCTFQPSSKQFTDGQGRKKRLTGKETDILCFLYRADQQPVARDVLLREVWGYNNNIVTHTLETHIFRLRRKLEQDPARPQLLVTEAGGYKLLP